MRGLAAPLIKLLVFLVVTSLATYVLAATIANTSFGSTNTYHAYFSDVSGLQSGDDVRVAGVRVGTVSSIKLVTLPESQKPAAAQQQVRGRFISEVSFTVAKSRPLLPGVKIQLRYRNLVGQRYLDVQEGASGQTGVLKPSHVIALSQTAPAVDLTVLFQGFKPLFTGLDSNSINDLSFQIIQTLQGEGGTIEQLLSTLADLTNSIADKDAVIGQVIDNLATVLTTIGDRDTELDNLIVQLQGFVSGLADDRDAIGNAIVGVNNLANKTAGLLTDIRGPLAKDITDVTGLVGVLNQNTPEVTFFLKNLAPTIGTLIRTASYGSWFNFYLCSTDGELTLPGGQVITLNGLASPKARCH